MGILDIVAGQIKNHMKTMQNAQLEAQGLDSKKLGGSLINLNDKLKLLSYVKVFRNKCNMLSNDELKCLFDDFQKQKNTIALKAMLLIMEQRGLIQKGKKGKYKKTYRK